MHPRGTFWIYQSGDSLAKEKYASIFKEKSNYFVFGCSMKWSQWYIRALPDMQSVKHFSLAMYIKNFTLKTVGILKYLLPGHNNQNSDGFSRRLGLTTKNVFA